MTVEQRNREARVAEVTLRLARDAEIPVVVLDPRQRRIEAVNSVFLDVFGCEADDLLGERYDRFVPEEARSRFRNLLSIAAYGGSQESEDLPFRPPEGEDAAAVSVVGVPNVLEDPTAPVALLCRPRGKPVGRPIGPPEIFTAEGDGLDRIPPRERLGDSRRMNDTSRRLWG